MKNKKEQEVDSYKKSSPSLFDRSLNKIVILKTTKNSIRI